MKAQDLQKALNPEIWPMRVKVREYIYYKKKPDQSNRGNGSPGHVVEQQRSSLVGEQHQQPGAVSGQDQAGVSTENRFEVLNQEVINPKP